MKIIKQYLSLLARLRNNERYGRKRGGVIMPVRRTVETASYSS